MPFVNIFENGSNYNSQTWVDNTQGEAGLWKISTPSGTIAEIANSNESGRYSIGDQSFFILASGRSRPNTATVKYIFDQNYIPSKISEGLGVAVNYNWFGGSRRVIFSNYNNLDGSIDGFDPVLGLNSEYNIFNIVHSGSDQLNLAIDIGTQGRFLIDSNAWQKAYFFYVELQTINNGVYTYNFNAYRNDENSPLFVSNVLSPYLLNAITFIASGATDTRNSVQRNYGLFFNDIFLNLETSSSSSSNNRTRNPTSVSRSSVSDSSLSESIFSSTSSEVLISSSSSFKLAGEEIGSNLELTSCTITGDSLFTSSEIQDFHNAINAHFDTFKRKITVHKEPIKNIFIDNQQGIFGYNDLSNEDVNYIIENKCFPAVIKYDPNAKELEGVLDIKSFKYKQIVKIKVKQDARDYILTKKTEKISFDDKDFNVISDDIPKNYQGLKYYCFYLELIS